MAAKLLKLFVLTSFYHTIYCTPWRPSVWSVTSCDGHFLMAFPVFSVLTFLSFFLSFFLTFFGDVSFTTLQRKNWMQHSFKLYNGTWKYFINTFRKGARVLIVHVFWCSTTGLILPALRQLQDWSSSPLTCDFTNNCWNREISVELCTYWWKSSLVYTDVGVVLCIMVWKYMGDKPIRYTLL